MGLLARSEDVETPKFPLDPPLHFLSILFWCEMWREKAWHIVKRALSLSVGEKSPNILSDNKLRLSHIFENFPY